MQFAIAAILKPGAEKELVKYSDEFNEHVGPNGEAILLAGALLDEMGKKVGYLAILESDTIAEVHDWVGESPITRADLYDRLDIFRYQVEVGRLG